MYYGWKTLHILTLSFMYTCTFMYFLNSTINTYKFKSSVEVYPIDVNPIEAYLIGKGVVELYGFAPGSWSDTGDVTFC